MSEKIASPVSVGPIDTKPLAVTFLDNVTPRPKTVEWQTIALFGSIMGLFLVLTFFHRVIPLWILWIPGGLVVTWYTSFQHEVVHGHPTPWAFLNRLLGSAPLCVWLPFEIFRESHLQHHRDVHLTDPVRDPESFYVTQHTWQSLALLQQWVLLANNTLIGRLLISPFLNIARLWRDEIKRLLSGDASRLKVLVFHLASVAFLFAWITQICGMSISTYILCFALPGTSFLMLRSFLEHQSTPAAEHRTAIVESNLFFSLLFLYNNLHIVHHQHPGLAWYAIPHKYRENKSFYLKLNDGYFYRSYRQVAKKYLLKRKEHPLIKSAQ